MVFSASNLVTTVPYRNEQQLQDLSVEPIARLILDYVLVLYGSREPVSYSRLMELVGSSYDQDEEDAVRQKWTLFLQELRSAVSNSDDHSAEAVWDYVQQLLTEVGEPALVALSPEYQAKSRLDELVDQVKSRLQALIESDPDICTALTRFGEDRAVRIMTIHKSKWLEFDSVIMLGVEKEAYWADPQEERCLFFVGISRAKRRLILTHADSSERPAGYFKMWVEKRTPHQEFIAYTETQPVTQ
jgi:superfamily I DNA/RNA helicase